MICGVLQDPSELGQWKTAIKQSYDKTNMAKPKNLYNA